MQAPSQSKVVDVETDVDSLKSKLANLTEQQTLAKNIKDQQNMSIFRADFKPLKRTILPNISKTIIQMQDALPKLGREKMEQFNEDCKSLKGQLISKHFLDVFYLNRSFFFSVWHSFMDFRALSSGFQRIEGSNPGNHGKSKCFFATIYE